VTAPAFFFYVFAALAVGGALGMVLNVRNTVSGAMSLVLTMVSLGGVYVLLEAYLVGVLQILVYAGAIVVLFLFVVMLLNLRSEAFGPERQGLVKVVGVAAVAVLLAEFVWLLPGTFGPAAALPEGFGGYRALGLALFTDWLLAFEVTALLLLAAMVGAVVLAKRRIG
jgi:NADH-quinone oxidoreductase subunit J